MANSERVQAIEDVIEFISSHNICESFGGDLVFKPLAPGDKPNKRNVRWIEEIRKKFL